MHFFTGEDVNIAEFDRYITTLLRGAGEGGYSGIDSPITTMRRVTLVCLFYSGTW